MFTGLVQDLGKVAEVHETTDGVRIAVESPLASELSDGDSIAVNGVCLTATGICGDRFGADVMHETLRRSSLGEVGEGSRVNLELALRADARLGGHMVQGHVDGVGRIVSRTPGVHWEVVRIALPADLARYVVEKGSIAVDGVSLTVSAVSPLEADDPWFEVSLIPTTLRETTLGGRAPGDPVNLEVDVIAKYVERLLGARS